ncbi:DUF2514 family protein [Pseudomonas sp. RL_15y_Pfl2_60]|uniref:DUF2514 family protein n=1 Tax=Pseudomonas sp. RL_15y_Pfl2_60 TaxID=3088709 RepID=UPI0030DD0711
MSGLSVERLIVYAVIALALVSVGVWVSWAITDNSWQAKHSEYVAQVEKAARAAGDQARSEEQRRQAAIEGIRQDAQSKIDAAAVDATVAGATADSLRAELARLKRSPASCPGVTNRGEAGADSTTVLADLLEEVERAGRAMAEEAQRRGDAGSACEKSYDSLWPDQ